MLKSRIISTFGLGSILIAGALFVGGCSNKITEEQLAKIQSLRTKQGELTESLSKSKDEKSKLEQELRERKSELTKCQDELNFVKQKLSMWPDIWPDWKPVTK